MAKKDKITRYFKMECREIHLALETLGRVFERFAGVDYDEDNPMSCFSKEISINALENINPDFRRTNGGHAGGRVSFVKLDGANNKSIKRNRGIKKEIFDEISKRRCSILNVGTQKFSDFQALSKAAIVMHTLFQ